MPAASYTCAAAALLGWRRPFTEDDLYANGPWLEGRHCVTERRLWQTRPSTSTVGELVRQGH